MILRYANLQRYPRVFLAVTGLKLPEFASLLDEVLPLSVQAEQRRHLKQRPAHERQRALGGGHPFTLPVRDHYSGKKKAHTLKTQVVVQPDTGLFIDVSGSVRGPTNDHTLVRESGARGRLPSCTVMGGDLGYVGAVKEPGDMEVVTPRRKP